MSVRWTRGCFAGDSLGLGASNDRGLVGCSDETLILDISCVPRPRLRFRYSGDRWLGRITGRFNRGDIPPASPLAGADRALPVTRSGEMRM